MITTIMLANTSGPLIVISPLWQELLRPSFLATLEYIVLVIKINKAIWL